MGTNVLLSTAVVKLDGQKNRPYAQFVRIAVVLMLVTACSSSDKTTQAECDNIETRIRQEAAAVGLSPQGVCASADPGVQARFGKACADLKDCRARCCE